ncbi:hypothetical protein CEE37_08420 [candidate division LCP-89 bacterium B3_LCP]|uniref:DUF3644 domain-containing protein n=1 Tax=candidate division LCP-89 bacterium B3_LCP TaxID=2012998 RepID=A0A532UZG1_UNCL8|nr:MAG: hypothetical protein CEE37_08420 [candidate division LCP-89 bacterium B3_LCP]
MAQVSRSIKFLRKAEAALIAAIEIYNKPDFKYREESFTILALNSWELLLKAKLVAENKNNIRCIYAYEKRQKRNGKPSNKLHLKKNRSGNISTIGLIRVITKLENNTSVRFSEAVKKNIDALIEIRDNAIHYVNTSPQLAKQVLEIGTASVKNWIQLAGIWFTHDLSNYNLFLMPIGFIGTPEATALAISQDEKNLVRYLADLVRDNDSDSGADFHVSLAVNFSFKRSTIDAATEVIVTNDPNALKIQMTEENIRNTYPWDYGELTSQLKRRYSDFKVNLKYHSHRKPLMQDLRFVKPRYLDPNNPRSLKKDFYNPNIFKEFDKHYKRNN